MKPFIILLLCFFAFGCKTNDKQNSSINPENWEKRSASYIPDSLKNGSTYLSVYSHIYSITEHQEHDLTATVSLRNVSIADTLYLSSAKYYGTKGNLIRSYFEHPIYIAPLETIEIVIDQLDKEGGSGANFIFDWFTLPNSPEPLFECVMISTSGQQGLSFKTEGRKVNG